MCNNLDITTNEHGIILVNGEQNNPIARTLTTLLAYLAEIFRKYAIIDYRAVAMETILMGKINGHFITIEVPHQIREKKLKEKQWEIPSDIIQMNKFYFKKITEN